MIAHSRVTMYQLSGKIPFMTKLFAVELLCFDDDLLFEGNTGGGDNDDDETDGDP